MVDDPRPNCYDAYLPVAVCFVNQAFLDGSVGRKSVCSAGDTGIMGLIPGSGRSPGKGNGNSLQYSCLGNRMDRGAWWDTVHRVTELDTAEQLSAS